MRDILVHTTNYATWSHATEYAARLAVMLRAGLTGLWCIEPVNAAIAGDVGAMVAVAAAFPNRELEAAAAVADRFRSWAASLGVAHSDWLACEADAAEALHHVGQWHDLLVLGADKDAPWGTEPALAEILVTSQRPCLVVPEARLQAPHLQRIAVAWDGSASALRALHASLPLLQRARRIVVLNGEKSDHPPTRMPAFDLERYWERHELAVERVPFAPSVGPIGGALLNAAMAANADLLVLGAFGHGRLREWMLGGVSRHVLAHSPIPLLMRH